MPKLMFQFNFQKLTGQVVLVTNMNYTYAIFVYVDYTNSGAAGCTEEVNLFLRKYIKFYVVQNMKSFILL